MKKLILRAFLTFTVFSMVLSPVYGLDDSSNLQLKQNTSIQKIINNVSENDIIDYVYIDEPHTTNNHENVVLKLKDEYKNASNIVLSYSNESNESQQVVQTKKIGSNILFKIDNLKKGTYQLSSLTFEMDDSYYQSSFTKDYDITFSVSEVTYSQSLARTNESISSEMASSTQIKEVDSLDDALKTVSKARAKDPSGHIVVYLDPGHDNTHIGSRNTETGINEEEYNLKIAQACQKELQKYQNVTVYLSRNSDGSCPYPGTTSGNCNANRVKDAANKGADIYIALHLNSTTNELTTASGAEVWISNYSSFHGDAQKLGNIVIENLKALGLGVHGEAVKTRNTTDTSDYYYSDGTIKDYYGIMKEGVYNNVNAIIIEHAFLNNTNDANIIKNKTSELGIADAKAIARYFNLSIGSYISLNGFTWQVLSDHINIGSAYYSNDSDTRFTFKSYNLDTKEWKTLGENKSSNWQAWYPEKGNYWIYCRATTSTGYSTDQVMCFAVGKSYAPYVQLNGFTWQVQSDKILLGTAYDTNDSDVRFTFKSYNLDTKKWETLSTNKSSNWQTWNPYAGNYWVYCEAKTSIGYTTSQVMCFAVGKNYAPYVQLNGFTWQIQSDRILLGASYTSNDSDCQFSFKVYNLNTKKWETLSTYKHSNWQDWKPERGNYWIYCEAKTSNGYTANQTMCFAVAEDYSGKLYKIMGNSGITVDQMVAYYQKNNSTYDDFHDDQYDGCLAQGGAPDIRTYCQIFLEEARQEGVKVEVAFAQTMLETGFLKFGGDVGPNQYNFAGLGATGGGAHGNSFPDVRTGIRAQIQHLKCYASNDALNNKLVDPRWNNNLRGKAIYVEYLSIPNNPYNTGWAASATYGQDLLRIITALYKC